MSIYLDASFLIPTLVKEQSSDAIRACLARGQQRLISDFTAVEVASALSRLVRTGQLAAGDAVARLGDFQSWRAATSRRWMFRRPIFGSPTPMYAVLT